MQKYGNYVFTREKTIYTTNKTEDINNELISLGFVISDINIDTYDKIKECFVLPKDKRIFELLESSVKDINLPIAGKRKLINHLTTQNAEKKLTDVGDESIRSLYLCHNHSGELMPLCDLIGRKYRIPSWLTDYQIKSEDYFSELDKFLMPEKYVYSNIIYKYWDNILVYKDVENFYKETKRLYDQNADYNKTLKGKKYIYTENDEFVAAVSGNNSALAESFLDIPGKLAKGLVPCLVTVDIVYDFEIVDIHCHDQGLSILMFFQVVPHHPVAAGSVIYTSQRIGGAHAAETGIAAGQRSKGQGGQ